jgi:uncharacterized protein YcgI (DUF1989 family)
LIATVRLTDGQVDLARREIARRRPAAALADGLVAVATEQLAAELAAPVGAAPGEVPPAPELGDAPRIDVEVAPGAGVGVALRRGECLRVEQVADGQGTDLIAYDLADARGRLSAARSRMFAGIRPRLGSDLWSGAPVEAPLLTIVADSCASHDLTFPACSRFEYAHYAGLDDHANCFDVHAAVVRGWGMEPGDVPDPLNLWLPTSVDATGALVSAPTVARRGDHVDLLAQRDVLAVVGPCPDDVFGTSRWDPQPIRILVAPAAADVRKRWLRTASPTTAPGARPLPGDPSFLVARRFPAPAVHEISVDIPDDVLPRLEVLRRSGRLGDDPAAVLRGVFFRAWLNTLRDAAGPGAGF